MGLYTKIAEVIAEVEEVAKTGHNDHFNYDYATAEAVLRVIRTPLAAKGVVLLPSLQSVEERPYQTANRQGELRESVITTAHIRYTFIDAETGETHDCDWAGQGDDPSDKGWGKSATNAAKTFLRTAFLLPQGDDPEADGEADKRAQDRKSSGARASHQNGKPSAKQLDFLKKIIDGKTRLPKPSLEQLVILLEQIEGAPKPEPGWTEKLTVGQMRVLLDRLTGHPLPDPVHRSDVPSDGIPAEPSAEELREAEELFAGGGK